MSLKVLTPKLIKSTLENLYLRTFSFSGQFDTKSLSLSAFILKLGEKAAMRICHQDMNILSGRVMSCLPLNIWNSCTGLFSQ